MPEKDIEVAVVGSGPAGLATAMHLVRLDPTWTDRLVVLEKAKHPRHKLCAGGITRFGLDQLSLLGLTLGVPFMPVNQLRLRYGDRSVRVLGRPIIVVTRRQEFDAWLAATARSRGVCIQEETPVTGLERQGDHVLLHTPRGDYRARAMVGADGSTGITRRWLGARERPSHVARLLEVITDTTSDDPEHRDHLARIDFTGMRQRLQGYFWDFPCSIEGEPHMNCGVYDARLDVSRRRASLPDHLTAGILHARRQGENLKLRGHPIHRFSPGNRFSAPGVVLVGDAAGADPLFGEGIGVGLGYGAVAAGAIDLAHAKRDFSFNNYRRRLLPSRVGCYLLLRWLVASVAYRMGEVDLFVRGLWRAGAWLAPLAYKNDPSPAIPAQLRRRRRADAGEAEPATLGHSFPDARN